MRYLTLVPFILAVALMSATGAYFRPGSWYLALAKPWWTPPGWLFGPAWLVLYVLIAIAGWLVWERGGWSAALAVWCVQLGFNAAWSWLMFGQHQIGGAMLDVAALWLAIAAFIVLAWPLSQTASLLFLPYLAWVTFAGALNFTIWRLNP